MDRFVRPDTTKLAIADGDWILIRRRLTMGEARAQLERAYPFDRVSEKRIFDPLQSGLALVLAYLLDWSLPFPIRDRAPVEVQAALDQLDKDDFAEIRDAIETHEKAIDAEREEQKKTRRT